MAVPRRLLVVVAKELNDKLGLDPQIDTALSSERLIDMILEAAELLTPKDNEILSSTTIQTISDLRKQFGEPEEEEEPEEEDDAVEEEATEEPEEEIEEGAAVAEEEPEEEVGEPLMVGDVDRGNKRKSRGRTKREQRKLSWVAVTVKVLSGFAGKEVDKETIKTKSIEVYGKPNKTAANVALRRVTAVLKCLGVVEILPNRKISVKEFNCVV
jgi:hypothetical protein